MAVYDQGYTPVSGAQRAGALVNFAGAAVSCALIVGVGVWGYKLVVRDVSGIPVVRAMAGEMRILPENPGGEVSDHTGLSVNAIAGVGEAAAPEDSVALAPVAARLADEDLEAQPTAEASEMQAVDPVAPTQAPEMQVLAALNAAQMVDAPLSTTDILALADQIAAGAAPLTSLSAGTDVAPTLSLGGQVADGPVIAPSVRGVSVSLRPTPRPSSLRIPVTPAAAPTPDAAAVTTAAFAVGTSLVQIGAFPSADVAAAQWAVLQGRFGAAMDGKTRVIQAATSGGKTFYRLRAQGFGDLSDARRFCAALVAEGADCIPVVVR